MPEAIFASHPRPCIDLRAMFRGVFRFVWDPAYDIEHPDYRSAEAPWLTRIPCRDGWIAPIGGRRLSAYANRRTRIIAALPCVEVIQGSLGLEVVVAFDVTDLDTVATAMGARRRRYLSEEQRERLRRVSAPYHFRKKHGAESAIPGAKSASETETIPRVGGDRETGCTGRVEPA
jgi:hypothetical protein